MTLQIGPVNDSSDISINQVNNNKRALCIFSCSFLFEIINIKVEGET